MAEYINVEKPFLDKLTQIGWEVRDLGQGIPKTPTTSLRTSFKEVTLKAVFKKAVSHINRTDTGKEWLTDKQLEYIYQEVTATERSNLALLEANQEVHKILRGGIVVDKNELTGETHVKVRLIDFEHWDSNSFIAINQFVVDTKGKTKSSIRPDIVLFVNGLPLIVVECKDEDVSEPFSDAIDQLERYADRREDDFGNKEGEERLFHYNLLMIATHGREARFGTITSEFEHFLNWKDIFPEEYKTIPIEKYDEVQHKKEPAVHQEITIRGILNKEILVDILYSFTVFMEVKKGVIAKIICRYQQYRAVGKILKRLRLGHTAQERSGVIWHTQGSGKSLTMVFLIRKLRTQEDVKDFKIILVNDRTDLEDQLSQTAKLSDEKVNVIESRKDLKPQLSGSASDLNMVMIHKFLVEEIRHSAALQKAMYGTETVPEFKPFEVVNKSDRILILIDEAHRTQGGDMGDNLFAAFPEATKIAFTGTPLLTERHKKKTHERFGNTSEWIDTYKIKESVRDRATLNIVYIGKTNKDKIKDGMQAHFDDVFAKQTKEEREEIQKRYGTMQAYLENMDRLEKIANDIVEHYVKDILPNGFKAQVVASSVLAAARYENLIMKALKKRIAIEKEKADGERDDRLIEQMAFCDACTVVSAQDNNEVAYIVAASKKAKERNAVENFKKDFDYSKPETGIAFLCVCDRLLTGFDAPIEQVMYLDKNLREHDLLQTIARVNRTKKDKAYGLVIDYFGVANNLKDALAIYGEEDETNLREFLEYFKDINKELPVLEARYNRLIQLFEDNGIKEIADFVNQNITDKKAEYDVAESIVVLAKEVRVRAQFDTYLKAFFDSLDLLFNVDTAKKYWIPAKRFGYLLMRIRNRYKDATLDLKWAKPKIRKMIDQYLISEGIDSTIAPISLFSDDFPKELNKNPTPNSKASDMEHAIRRHIKVNSENDPVLFKKFQDRMNEIMERFKDNWERQLEEFDKLKNDMATGREDNDIEGVSKQALPFYDIIVFNAFGEQELNDKQKEIIKKVVIEIVDILQNTIDKPHFWNRDSEVKALRSDISDSLDFCGDAQLSEKSAYICTEVMALAKKRHDELTK
jgi:type I restriction enzyme, R subunit